MTQLDRLTLAPLHHHQQQHHLRHLVPCATRSHHSSARQSGSLFVFCALLYGSRTWHSTLLAWCSSHGQRKSLEPHLTCLFYSTLWQTLKVRCKGSRRRIPPVLFFLLRTQRSPPWRSWTRWRWVPTNVTKHRRCVIAIAIAVFLPFLSGCTRQRCVAQVLCVRSFLSNSIQLYRTWSIDDECCPDTQANTRSSLRVHQRSFLF